MPPPRPSDTAPDLDLRDIGAEPIVVVDDDSSLLESMRRFLSQVGYEVQAFGSAKDALASIRQQPPKVVLTDKDMEGMDGLQLASRCLELDPSMRIIVFTGAGDETAAQASLRLGVFDYLIKPVELKELAQSVQRAFVAYARDEYLLAMDVWLHAEIRRRTENAREVTLGTLATLLNALDARSPHFRGHSSSVGECAEGIARILDLPGVEIDAIRIAGLLHDIGMIGIPDAVLDKPGVLSGEEQAAIRSHCRKGAEILAPLRHLEDSIRYVLEHHERIDGSGYPDRKKGDEISSGGQIVGLSEVWTALTEPRAFRDQMSDTDALATIRGASGQWFSPQIVSALHEWVESRSIPR